MPSQNLSTNVFPVWEPERYRMAGFGDLIELLPVPGGNPLFLEKKVIETLVYAIVQHQFCHLSGPTGSAKTSLIDALSLVPENFLKVCQALGQHPLPVKVFPIEMAIFEAPGELYQRRALKDGTTYDESSSLVASLEAASQTKKDSYPLIWLREMGRVHSSSVQGGLMNLMSPTDIVLPDGRRLDGSGIAWVADSNYQAEKEATHTLVLFDTALQRRFTVNLTLGYLAPEQEVSVLLHLVKKEAFETPDMQVIEKVVKLGQIVRRHQEEGNISSIPPPTISGYLALLRMASVMSHMSLHQVAGVTLLGNASRDDTKVIRGIFNEVFGLQAVETDDFSMGSHLF